ncbi:mitochondrial tRNA-specific 2-thiouridylase 1-like isoform X3 [Macrobrachium nipponense]|uniref:mitochondrial tRNA-specific 2-thiouridylase 1-like isoform X3 n=1 Tax=Macrobrachium nipponense TaxID=159736 RepID=UPI0030C8AA18
MRWSKEKEKTANTFAKESLQRIFLLFATTNSTFVRNLSSSSTEFHGYEVIGVFMRNWDIKDEKGHCQNDVDAEDAEWICRRLDIPFQEVNFVKEYWNDVFTYMLEEYKAGFTPNPDILCNKNMKFSTFLQYAQDVHSTEVIATGHYARNSFGEDLEYYDPNTGARLLQGIDRWKDQTFYLSQIPQKSLQQTMFPLGDYTKDVVRKIAENAKLDRVAHKKDSTGICFIGTRNFQNFISEVAGSDHPALYSSTLFTEPFYWISGPPTQLFTEGQFECMFRFQHTHPLVPCVITTHTNNPWHRSPTSNNMVISLAEPLRAITPGQFAVLYSGDECLGSSRIIRPGPSLYTLNINDCRTRILKEREEKKSLVCTQKLKVKTKKPESLDE